MQHKKEEKSKQAYEKPKLITIELAADEILAVGCKTTPFAPGKAGQGCTNPTCAHGLGS
jgi:hypothetical protein